MSTCYKCQALSTARIIIDRGLNNEPEQRYFCDLCLDKVWGGSSAKPFVVFTQRRHGDESKQA